MFTGELPLVPPALITDEAHPELKALQSSSEGFTFKNKLRSLAKLNNKEVRNVYLFDGDRKKHISFSQP